MKARTKKAVIFALVFLVGTLASAIGFCIKVNILSTLLGGV